MYEELRDLILDITEASLEAQLRAVRRMRKGSENQPQETVNGVSQIDMAYNVLSCAEEPELHISQIIERIRTKFGALLDRDTLVSALTKKVSKGQQF